MSVPILTIDGPSGSGKGAVSILIAKTLGWHLLDSGSLYRALAWLIHEQQNPSHLLLDETALSLLLTNQLPYFRFENSHISYQNQDITDAIRNDEISLLTSQISTYPSVRQAILEQQRQFAIMPGLVADGRDMGSVIFPDAPFKVFLTAHIQIRAQRRYEQLKQQQHHTSYESILTALKQRDQQDTEREISPLMIPKGAKIIDNSDLSLDQTLQQILKFIEKSQKQT